MKRLLILTILFFSIQICNGQKNDNVDLKKIENHLNLIRNNDVSLRQFLTEFPKGGDIHHHYSGSVYAETYLEYLEENAEKLWINRNSFVIEDFRVPPRRERDEWSKISSIKNDEFWGDVKVKLIESWSKLYYSNNTGTADEHFFATFLNFDIPKAGTYKKGLVEIKNRAISENVSYIETMFKSTAYYERTPLDKPYNRHFLKLQETKNEIELQDTLKTILKHYKSFITEDKETKKPYNVLDSLVIKHNKYILELHTDNSIDDDKFKMRYQNYVIRVVDPILTFKSLLFSFQSASLSDLVVGVNIVAPENNSISMKDYWLHMQFFKFLKNEFPNVNTSMHAGELTIGLVKPEDLTYHINDAIFIAETDRIGHGVDIAYERNSDELLKHMSENKIPVEINLSSNDFILGIKKEKHPILLYKSYDVPIVISTDDAGVLRTDLTEQFLILIRDYPSITYTDIKEMSFNSIEYSFMNDSDKGQLKSSLKAKFDEFESKLLKKTNANNVYKK